MLRIYMPQIFVATSRVAIQSKYAHNIAPTATQFALILQTFFVVLIKGLSVFTYDWRLEPFNATDGGMRHL